MTKRVISREFGLADANRLRAAMGYRWDPDMVQDAALKDRYTILAGLGEAGLIAAMKKHGPPFNSDNDPWLEAAAVAGFNFWEVEKWKDVAEYKRAVWRGVARSMLDVIGIVGD